MHLQAPQVASSLLPASKIAALLISLALATSACDHHVPAVKAPDGEDNRVAATTVSEAQFSSAVHRLLREGEQTTERSALLAGVVKRQLAHAAAHFDRNEALRGARAVVGAIYLVRTGETRPDMFDETSARALRGAIRRFSARGDAGRALALMRLRGTLLPAHSREKADLDRHIRTVQRWTNEVRTGSTMQRLAADERAAVGRALFEPTDEALEAAVTAINRWVARAVEYNLQYQRTQVLPPRSEVLEAYRALQTGGETMAAIFLRHGSAQAALKHVEHSAAARVTNPDFFAGLRATAQDDTAEDWRRLARTLARQAPPNATAPLKLDGSLLDAALWGISIEAFRRDPTSLAIGHLLAGEVVALGMPEVAPLVLRDALGAHPSLAALSAAMSVVTETLSEEYEAVTPDTARRVFDACKDLLALADGKRYAGKLEPSPAQLRRLMAGIELRSGHARPARALLERSLRSEPTVWGYTMLGMIERQIGELAPALKYALQAAELAGSDGDGLDTVDAKLLAFDVLRDQQQYRRARHTLNEALKLLLHIRSQQASPEVRVRTERLLARLMDSYGERNRALRALQRALEVATNHGQLLGPTVLEAVGRALVYGNVEAARAALQVGIKADIDREDLVYGALWLMLLETQLGQTPDGKVERILSDAVGGSSWTSTLAKWARGMIDDGALLAAATRYAQHVEAEFYLAMRRRAKGLTPDEAKLQKVAHVPLVELMEVQIARHLLARPMQAKLPDDLHLP